MDWVLVILLWHNDAISTRVIEMYDQRTCEVAAAAAKQQLTKSQWSSRVVVEVACVQRKSSK